MLFYTLHRRTAVLRYVQVYALPDCSEKQMLYYTHHNKMAAHYYASVYVSPDFSAD